MGVKKINSENDLFNVKTGDIIEHFNRLELVTNFSVIGSLTNVETARRDGDYIELSFYCDDPESLKNPLKPWFVMKGVKDTSYVFEKTPLELIFNYTALNAKLKEKGM